MRIKRFKCFIKEVRGHYFIVPKNPILRFFGFFPIGTAKGHVINPASNYREYSEAKRDYNIMMKERYIEV